MTVTVSRAADKRGRRGRIDGDVSGQRGSTQGDFEIGGDLHIHILMRNLMGERAPGLGR